MDFALSDIQTMLLDGAERLLGEDANVEYWRKQRRDPLGFDRARWSTFAELGWLALPMPEAAGGLDGTVEDVALLNIALGKALAPEPYASTVVLAGNILKGAANPRTEQLLGEIAGGTLLVALAHQEAGRDAISAEASTVARRQGDGFELDGAKLIAFDAPSADLLIVSARVEGEDGTGLFLVERGAEGVALDSYPLVGGGLAADVRLKRVQLANDALLVGGNAGASLLAEAIDHASIAQMAQAVGAMEACLRLCADYARERRQFGVAIGSFQAIQHMMTDMFVAAHQARSMLYHAISHAGEAADQRAAAISAARIVVGEASQLVAQSGIQLHGGYGLADEYAVSHYYRRLMTLEKSYGDIGRHVRRFGDSRFESHVQHP